MDEQKTEKKGRVRALTQEFQEADKTQSEPRPSRFGFQKSMRSTMDFFSPVAAKAKFNFSSPQMTITDGDSAAKDGKEGKDSWNVFPGKQQQQPQQGQATQKSLFNMANETFVSKPTSEPAPLISFGPPAVFGAPAASAKGSPSHFDFGVAPVRTFQGAPKQEGSEAPKLLIPTTDRRRLEQIEKDRLRGSPQYKTPRVRPVKLNFDDIPSPKSSDGENISPKPTVRFELPGDLSAGPSQTTASKHQPFKSSTVGRMEIPSAMKPSTTGFIKPSPTTMIKPSATVMIKPSKTSMIKPSPTGIIRKHTPEADMASDSTTGSEQDLISSSNPTSDSDSDEADKAMLKQHLRLLEKRADTDDLNEIATAPLFTEPVRKHAHSLATCSLTAGNPYSQYGLLGGDISGDSSKTTHNADPRIYWNIAAPSSFFICGSQGSGKSHHLSCLLENALAPCSANVLPRPLTGILFHYDTFVSDTGGSPCEAAWLSTNPKIKVRVLCPPTNIRTMKKLYGRFPNIHVQELRLNERDLDTKRMLNLMAVSSNGNMPLYMSVVNRILRELRVSQQQSGLGLDYSAFKQRLCEEELTEMQMAPLKQRLDTLESFMVEGQAKAFDMEAAAADKPGAEGGKKKKAKSKLVNNTQFAPDGKSYSTSSGIDWSPKHGTLTIVDLSCPCVTSEMACSLFNICLSLFLEQDSTTVGRVIALDEAHKYMNDSAECQMLTQALLETIRLQRHLGARVLISTQEPTISPKLLDLCSVTVVHRFTSPDWLNALRKHIAGVSKGAEMLERATRLHAASSSASTSLMDLGEDELDDSEPEEKMAGVSTLDISKGGRRGGGEDSLMKLFGEVVSLKVGEALIFAPSAIIGVRKKRNYKTDRMDTVGVQRLAHGALKVRVRNRTTPDGGKSIMAA